MKGWLDVLNYKKFQCNEDIFSTLSKRKNNSEQNSQHELRRTVAYNETRQEGCAGVIFLQGFEARLEGDSELYSREEMLILIEISNIWVAVCSVHLRNTIWPT